MHCKKAGAPGRGKRNPDAWQTGEDIHDVKGNIKHIGNGIQTENDYAALLYCAGQNGERGRSFLEGCAYGYAAQGRKSVLRD